MQRLRFHFYLISILLVSLLPLIQAHGAVNLWQSTTVTTVGEGDIELLRVVDEYFNALRSKDWQRLDELEANRPFEVILKGNDSHGPFLQYNASLELIKQLLAPYKIETLTFTIDKLEMRARDATAHVRLTMRVYDPNTGANVIDFVNLTRVLYLDKYQSAWKLKLNGADSASLEEQIKRAKTSVEQQFLLSQENLSGLDEANKRLKQEGLRLLKQESLAQAFSVLRLAQEIDDHLHQRAVIAAETRAKQREASITKYRALVKHKDIALNLLWAGQDYAELKDYVKAEAYFSESIKLLGQLGEKQELAKAYSEIAAVYLEQGKYSQAISSYQNSIDKYILIITGDKAERSFAISRMDDAIIKVAYLYSAQGKYDLVEKFILSYSEEFKKLGETEDAILLPYVIAVLEMARGDNAQAAKDLEQILLKIEQSGQTIEDKDEAVASIRLMLAILYTGQSNFTAAAQQFEKMRPVKINTEDALGWSNLLQFMDGLVYGAQGNEGLMASRFKKTMPALMDIGLEDFSVPDVLQASCMGYLSESAFEDELPQKGLSLALQCFQFSADISEKVGDKIHAARAYQYLAGLYANKHDHAKELKHYLQGLSLLEDRGLAFEEQYLGQATIDNLLLNAGGAYRAMGDYEVAISTYRKILERKNLRLFRFYEQGILLNTAEAYYALGKLNETTRYTAEAVYAAMRSGDRETLRDAYVLAGKAYRALGQPDEARQHYQAAIDAIENVRPQVAGSEQSAARFFEDQLIPYQVMVELLLSQGKKEDALSYVERSKSKVLLDILKNGRKSTAPLMTDSEQKQEYDLRRKLILINRQVMQTHTDDPAMRQLRNQRIETRLDYELFRAQLYINHPELREHPDYAQQIIKTEDLGYLLTSPSDAVLEFMVTEKKTYLFVLTKQHGQERARFDKRSIQPDVDCKVYELNIEEKQLSILINNFRMRVSHPEGVIGQEAVKLYELLLGRARKQLADKRLLIIIPDGILWNLPFQALKPAEDQYLLEASAIYYAPSLTALRVLQNIREGVSLKGKRSIPAQEGISARSPIQTPSLLVIGNPNVCENKNCDGPHDQSREFDPLPESERLAKKLCDLYGSRESRIYLGDTANESTIKGEASNYHVIHISAHGVLDNDNPMYSFLALSQSTKMIENRSKGVENVGVDDGFLEAWELMDLQLKGEMIVLSSCDTARGKIRKGEGIVGFSWAALMAGCPTVVVGQWQVDETSTSELMYDFHKRWREERITNQTHVNVASALQQSALVLLRGKKYSHPYYWAGFTIVGVGH